MFQEEKKIEERENRILGWVKNPENAMLLIILAFAVIIRLYYFIITKDQALWWDEACYGSLAKNFLTHQWDNTIIIKGEMGIRPLLLPLLWAVMIKLNFPEIFSKFLFVLVPSIFTIPLVYLLLTKLYNKKVALICSAIFAISWIHVFYSVRLLTSVPALFFSIASMFFFFNSVTDKIKTSQFALSIFFLMLSVLMRWSFGLLGFAYLFYLIFTLKLGFLRQKSFWYGSFLGASPLLLFFLISFLTTGNAFSALGIYSSSAGEKTAYAFYTFGFFPHILQTPLFIIFLFGLIVVLVQIVLGFGFISKMPRLKYSLFFLFLLALNLAFLIFFIKYSEDRYLFECLISIFLLPALGLEYIYNFALKYKKSLAILIVIGLLAYSAYYQYGFGDSMIKVKADSFSQVKAAFLWIKENTPPQSRILSVGTDPWTIYYGERMQVSFDTNLNQTGKFDYVVLHGFSKQPEGFLNYIATIENNLTTLNAFFLDQQKQQPIVVIYEAS